MSYAKKISKALRNYVKSLTHGINEKIICTLFISAECVSFVKINNNC